MDTTYDLLTLALLPGVGPRARRELPLRGAARDLLARPEEHADLLGEEARQALASGRARRSADEQMDRASKLGAAVVGRDEEAYPPLLARIFDPPLVLFVQGRLAGLGQDAIALVGSRACTPRGRTLTRAMARELAAAGAVIVSGLARGIDTEAHLGALDAGGRTVAVLGSGLDKLYPPENEPLALRVARSGGAVVTEFPFGVGPRPGHFPQRNRILCGWSRAVVVVEAAERSGALVTARLALEEGREVMAVPGHPSDPTAGGVNQLIRDGAALVRHAGDVAAELGMELRAPARERPADPLLAALRTDAPTGLEELAARSGLETSALLVRLSELEMADRVRRLPGPLYVRS